MVNPDLSWKVIQNQGMPPDRKAAFAQEPIPHRPERFVRAKGQSMPSGLARFHARSPGWWQLAGCLMLPALAIGAPVPSCSTPAAPPGFQRLVEEVHALRRSAQPAPAQRDRLIGSLSQPDLDGNLLAAKLLGLLLTDEGKSTDAASRLDTWLGRCPGDAELWRIRGYAARQSRDWLGSLRANGRSLQLEPGNAEAREAMSEAMGALAAPHGQAIWSPQPAPLGLQADLAGRDIRWADQVWPADPAHRHDFTDRGLAALDVVITQARAGLPSTAAILERAEMDRAQGLSQRQRHAEALAQIQALRARGVDIPPWLELTEAHALLTLRQPAQAEAAYQRVLQADPHQPEALNGRIYAALEQEHWDDAFTWSDMLVSNARSPQQQLEAKTFSAQLHSWADLQAPAWQALAPLAEQVPLNVNMRLVRANVAAARGWTRWSDEEIAIASSLRTDPRSTALAQAESDLRMGRYESARARTNELLSTWPDDLGLQRLAREVRQTDGGSSELQLGWSQGDRQVAVAPANGQSLSWRLQSPKLETSGLWRLLAGIDRDKARPVEGDVTRVLTGVGVGWLSPLLQAQAWAWSRSGGSAREGAEASVYWQATDAWGLIASHAIHARETPVRAELSGIDADHSALTVQHRWHESLAVNADLERLQYSDGNRADSVTLHAQWRAWARPLMSLTLRPYLSHASNSQPGGPYFAPREAKAASLDAELEHLIWRNYERSFSHGLTLTVGRYLQADQPNLPLWAWRYEQTWQPSAWTSLSWGLSTSRRPYDGVQERESGIHVRWTQRF